MHQHRGTLMKRKQAYVAPKIETEAIAIGVFGSYGDDDDGGHQCEWSPVNFFNPLFHWCCS